MPSDLKLLSPDEQNDLSNARILLADGELDDDTVLRLMCEGMDDPANRPIHLMMGLVAEQVMRLKIQGGRDVVIPLAALIHRNTKYFPVGEGYDETLAALRGKLGQAVGPRERMAAGLELGDRATHCAAGWMLNGKHVLRVMHRDASDRYSMDMARMGYRNAMMAAVTDPNNSTSRMIRESVPSTEKQLGEMVHVLRALKPDQDRFRNVLERWMSSVSIPEGIQ